MSLQANVVAQELEARGHPKISPTQITLVERSLLKSYFLRELEHKLISIYGIRTNISSSPSPPNNNNNPSSDSDIMASVQELGLKLDLAQVFWRRACVTWALQARPCTLSDVELEAELDRRDISHDRAATPRIVKLVALEICLMQETATFVENWKDVVEAYHGQIATSFSSELLSELQRRHIVSLDAPDYTTTEKFDLLFANEEIRKELAYLKKERADSIGAL
jgi:hypothetical protein